MKNIKFQRIILPIPILNIYLRHAKKETNIQSEFGIHEKTNRITVKLVDKTTKEVIKELPPEKTLDLIAKAWEMAGILVDEKR